MNNVMEDLILFYREWILRLQVDCLFMTSYASGEEDRREIKTHYDKRISFLRRCIAYCRRQISGPAKIQTTN